MAKQQSAMACSLFQSPRALAEVRARLAYGLKFSRQVLEAFVRHQYRQGLLQCLCLRGDLFAPAALEAVEI
jgi:hypothetical protein